MTISKAARWFGKMSVLLRDLGAISKGRILPRLGNRLMGRGISSFMRGKWF